MPKQKTVVIICDVCGEEIDGDYLLVRAMWGLTSRAYYVHNPRTAAIKPCGNKVVEKLEKLFPHSEDE